jgi:hypothetical protein
MDMSGPAVQSKPSPTEYAAEHYQPASWQDGLEKLHAEATSLRTELGRLSQNDPELSDTVQQLRSRLATVDQGLEKLSSPVYPPQGPQANEAMQGAPGELTLQPLATREQDPSEYLAMDFTKDPSEYLNAQGDDQLEDPSAALSEPLDEGSDPTVSDGDAEGPDSDDGDIPGTPIYSVKLERKPRKAHKVLNNKASNTQSSGSFSAETKSAPPEAAPSRARGGEVVELPRPAGGYQHLVAHGAGVDGLARPGEALGERTDVEFGLYAETLYDTDLRRNLFTAEIDLRLRWVDLRAVGLMPAGKRVIALSGEVSKMELWQPDIMIMNRHAESGGRRQVSISITDTGVVTRTEHSIVTCHHKYMLTDYPLDDQSLVIDIGSAKYSERELKLIQAGNLTSGTSKHFLDGEGYTLIKTNERVYDEMYGDLRKSQAYLEIKLARKRDKIVHTFIIPVILLMACSVAVFWFPQVPTFATLRMGITLIMPLVFRNLMAVGAEELPPSAPYTWFDLLCMNVQLNMAFVICWNIFIEVAAQGLSCTTTAQAVNSEMKVIAPVTLFFTFATVSAGAGPDGVLNLPSVALIVFFVFTFVNAIYISCVASTLKAEQAHNKFLGKRQAAPDLT